VNIPEDCDDHNPKKQYDLEREESDLWETWVICRVPFASNDALKWAIVDWQQIRLFSPGPITQYVWLTCFPLRLCYRWNIVGQLYNTEQIVGRRGAGLEWSIAVQDWLACGGSISRRYAGEIYSIDW
jgi:hypothetical protein